MKITLKEQNGQRHEYVVVVDADEVEQQLEGELQAIGSRAKVPGFRPGKVPVSVLKQRYGKDSMEKVVWDCINDKVRKLVAEKDLRPAMQPEINITEFDEGKDLTFTVVIEAMPDVPEIDYDAITVTKYTYDVDEKEVAEALERLAKQQVHTHEAPADTKAKKGDVVLIDFVGKRDGVEFPGGKGENFKLELGSGQFIPGFEDQLIGSKAGDSVSVNITFPEEYHSPDLSGQDATFDVTVHSVHHAHTPDVDNHLAELVGFDSIDALKEAVRKQLGTDYEVAAYNRAKKELFDILDKSLIFGVPNKMVEMEFQGMWQHLLQGRIERGESGDQLQPSTEEQENYLRIAERRVRLGIALAELGRKQNIKVTKDELTQAVIQQARMFPGQEQRVYEFYSQNPKQVEELKGPILEDKAVEFILNKVKRTEKKVTAEELFAAMDDEDATEAKSDDNKKASGKKSTGKKETK